MEEKHLCCTLNVPYPKLCKTSLNRNDAVMMQRLYAYKFCSLNNYIYQSFVLSEPYPEISDILDCIAMTELTHFKLYGKLLSNSGYNADYKSLMSFCSKLSRGNKPCEALEDILNSDFTSESESASNIRLVLSQIYNDTAVSLLQRILLDEEHHKEILSVLKQKYL